MVIYLYGEDSYRRNEKTKELIEAYKKKRGRLDFMVLDFEEEEGGWEKVREFLAQPSMFVDSKLALVKEGTANLEKEWIKVLKANLKATNVFLIISDRKKAKKKFDFLLHDPVVSQEFADLSGSELGDFLKKESAKRGLTFNPEAFRFFNSYVSTLPEKSWAAVNELDKLVLLKKSKPVLLDDLKSIIYWERREAPYLWAREVLGTKGVLARLTTLEKMLLKKEAAAYLFNSLAFQARGAIALKLADYDVSIKSGGLDYEEALTDFAISWSGAILGGSRRFS